MQRKICLTFCYNETVVHEAEEIPLNISKYSSPHYATYKYQVFKYLSNKIIYVIYNKLFINK